MGEADGEAEGPAEPRGVSFAQAQPVSSAVISSSAAMRFIGVIPSFPMLLR